MKVYIKVTSDKYEHIVAMADNPTALGRQLGLSRDTVASALKKAKDHGYNSCYKVVEIDDEEDEE